MVVSPADACVLFLLGIADQVVTSMERWIDGEREKQIDGWMNGWMDECLVEPDLAKVRRLSLVCQGLHMHNALCAVISSDRHQGGQKQIGT
jgi:hypothetical protein